MKITALITVVVVVLACGCSGNPANIAGPDVNPAAQPDARITNASAAHTNWGLWQFAGDLEAGTLDVIQLRTGAMHLNVVKFVDYPPLVYLTLESLDINGNTVTADIGLRHPFLGLIEFTGFDVKGILISDGSNGGFTDTALNLPGEGDTRLMNADGYTRWWNPIEFPDNGTIFGYTDGILGTPDSIADFSGVLNAYKYFCDDLDDPDDPLDGITLANRGMFSAGQKNVRKYIIQMEDAGLIFNYAVDASWVFPQGEPPWQAPDDFPAAANQPEAYRITISETENTLWYDEVEGSGGNLHLSIDVYDWFDAGLNTVYAEWPGLGAQASSMTPVGGGEGYSTYAIELNECTPYAAGDQPVLITIASEAVDYQDLVPGATVSSYFVHTTQVSDEPPIGGFQIVFSDEGILPEIYMPEWNDISPALCVETDGEIKMAYNHNMPYDPTPGVTHYARSYACKSTDGLNWYGFQPSFYSSGGSLACHGDSTKIVRSTDGNSWRTLHLWSPVSETFSTPFSAATEMGAYGIDGAHVTTYITRAPEIIQDAPGYVYVMGDQNNILQFKRSGAPGSLTGGGVVWGSFPIYQIGNGYFSRARSIELAPDDNMYFVYYVNDTANQIKLAYQSDSTGLVWDASTVAYDGLSTSTSGAHDPGLDIDPDGDFHVTFVRNDSTSGNDQLCYIHSTDGTSWTDPVVIAEQADPMNDDPVCFYTLGENEFISTVWKGGDHIYVSFSYDAGNNWYEATQVDSLLPENAQPDFVVTPDGVMHIAWAAMNGTQYDIHYRNAWLEES